MVMHAVEMVTPLHARCTCGEWEWNASRTGTWREWELVVRNHLNRYINCEKHGRGVPRTKDGVRCLACVNDATRASKRRAREKKDAPPTEPA